MPKIDLNADLGEGLPAHIDISILDLVTSANIACGTHAGDESTMARTVRAAVARDVRIGAHPSYPDRANFGRVSMVMPPEHLRLSVIDQVRELMKIVEEEDGTVSYVKPHGALYNDVAADPAVAEILFSVSDEVGLPLMVLAGSAAVDWADVTIIKEGFLDRGYMPDGSLVPRSEPGALITNIEEVIDQALSLATRVDSLCIHSDTPNAVDLLANTIEALSEEGFEIAAGS